jgi:ornithine carbamoyltransferase
MAKKHLNSLRDWSPEEIREVLALAHEAKRSPSLFREALAGKTLGMIFEKKSTRTRVSFETGIYQLGGMGLFLSANDLQLGRGEPIADTVRVLSRYLDLIMARTFKQETIDEFTKWSEVPVINGLSDVYHPCQALTDFMTMEEVFGDIAGLRFAYVGDGNNMAHSLLLCGAKLGVDMAIASPQDYTVKSEIADLAQSAATNSRIDFTTDPAEAIRGAHVVYTDVWTSMGQEEESAQRLQDFAGYEIDDKLMGLADPKAVFMHCLPAHRGEEVSASVCDGPRSIIFDQAENRLHAQKGLMLALGSRWRG